MARSRGLSAPRMSSSQRRVATSSATSPRRCSGRSSVGYSRIGRRHPSTRWLTRTGGRTRRRPRRGSGTTRRRCGPARSARRPRPGGGRRSSGRRRAQSPGGRPANSTNSASPRATVHHSLRCHDHRTGRVGRRLSPVGASTFAGSPVFSLRAAAGGARGERHVDEGYRTGASRRRRRCRWWWRLLTGCGMPATADRAPATGPAPPGRPLWLSPGDRPGRRRRRPVPRRAPISYPAAGGNRWRSAAGEPAPDAGANRPVAAVPGRRRAGHPGTAGGRRRRRASPRR